MPSAPSCALGTIIRDRNECLDAKFTPRHYYSGGKSTSSKWKEDILVYFSTKEGVEIS